MELRHYKFYDEEKKKYIYGRVLGEIEILEIYDSKGEIYNLIDVRQEEFAKNVIEKRFEKESDSETDEQKNKLLKEIQNEF